MNGINITTKYLLISVCDREILTESFSSLKEAQDAMHNEMIATGAVPSDIFTANEYEDRENDFGFGEYCAYVNCTESDWRIVPIG